MVEGFTIDHTHGGTTVASWVEGRPQRSVWTGISLGNKPRLEIETWRCGRCGFLEQYASGDPSRFEQSRKRTMRVVMIVAVVAALLLSIAAGLLAASR
jgi:hypothetical protein